MKNLFLGLIATVMFSVSANASNSVKQIEIKKEKITTTISINTGDLSKKADDLKAVSKPPKSIICWIVFIFSSSNCVG